MDHNSEESTVQNNNLRKIIKSNFREKLWIFIVCLILAGMMWTFTELTKEYTTDVKYKLQFVNVPENLMLVDQGDTTLTVGITAQGFELLETLYLKKNRSLEIDLSELRIKPDDHGFSAFLPTNKLLTQIGTQISKDEPPVYVKPDTLYFRFAEVNRSKVPVRLDIDLNFSPQFGLFDSIQFEPHFVSVSSIKNITDTLTSLTTLRTGISDIDSSFSIYIPIRKPYRASLIKLSDDSVKISVKVARFTEKEMVVPVSVRGNQNVKVFPETVKVKCLIPMQLYKDVNASMFDVSIDPDGTQPGTNKAKVKTGNIPAHCRLLSIEPQEVEFLIINK